MIPIEPDMKIPEGWRRVVFAEHQKEYLSLPSILENGDKGHVITCWKLSLKERIKLLLSGRFWLTVMTFHHPLQPILLSAEQPQFVVPKET